MTSTREDRHCPLPQCPPLTDAEIEDIAEKAAEKAVQKMTDELYKNIGKGVVSRIFTIAGVCTVGLYFWFKSKGWVQ